MSRHPSADELYERVKKKLPRISLATVYRNLEILSAAGMIRKIEISGRLKRFDWETEPHNHISCIRCHRVDNIELKRRLTRTLKPADNRGYKISGCRIEFTGYCPACRVTVTKKGGKKMGCKKCNTGLSDKQTLVLKALAKSKDPSGSKDIAAASGLEPKQVSCQITALKKKGFVSSPVRCKYEITQEGKKALS